MITHSGGLHKYARGRKADNIASGAPESLSGIHLTQRASSRGMIGLVVVLVAVIVIGARAASPSDYEDDDEEDSKGLIHQLMLHGIAGQLHVGAQAQLLRDPQAIRADGLLAQ